MATLIQILQNILANKDPFLAIETKRIVLIDILQVYVLDFIYNHPVYRSLNFYGGTCLHVVYGLNRLSEDLDFDNHTGLNLSQLAPDLAHHFPKTYDLPEASTKVQQREGGIQKVTVKLPVLYALGLSLRANETLHLKVESTSMSRWQ